MHARSQASASLRGASCELRAASCEVLRGPDESLCFKLCLGSFIKATAASPPDSTRHAHSSAAQEQGYANDTCRIPPTREIRRLPRRHSCSSLPHAATSRNRQRRHSVRMLGAAVTARSDSMTASSFSIHMNRGVGRTDSSSVPSPGMRRHTWSTSRSCRSHVASLLRRHPGRAPSAAGSSLYSPWGAYSIICV